MSATDDIADAIRDHDWPRFLGLALTDPVQAQAVYDWITLGIELNRARQDGDL